MSNIAGWSSMLGAGIGALDSVATPGGTGLGAFASGAGSGAAMGSAILPGIGTAVGGLLGGGMSLFTHRSEQRRMEEAKKQEEEAKRAAELSVRKGRQADLNSRFNVDGMNVPGFYAKGGNVGSSYLAEGGETIEHDPFALPETSNGNLNRMASDMSEIQGPSHDSKAGGVLMSGGDRIFSDQIALSPEAVKYFKKRV